MTRRTATGSVVVSGGCISSIRESNASYGSTRDFGHCKAGDVHRCSGPRKTRIRTASPSTQASGGAAEAGPGQRHHPSPSQSGSRRSRRSYSRQDGTDIVARSWRRIGGRGDNWKADDSRKMGAFYLLLLRLIPGPNQRHQDLIHL